MSILDKLFEIQDTEYADFQCKLTPGVDRSLFIGVRVPAARALAKKLKDDPEVPAFLADVPHKYFDENMLHVLLLSQMKDYEACVEEVEKFLPYVDNWAVCDIMSPKIFAKNKDKLLPRLKQWAKSKHLYTARFGVEMLMSFYLDDDFKPEYLEIPAAIKSDEYYMRMMNAWFYATALAKQWDATIVYLQENRLDAWTHNKTIQKARESYRITPEQKEYLKTLKRK